MKAGRKNLKKAVEEGGLSLQQDQSIMQVVSLRGSNLIEVMDAKGVKSLALFPAKFQKSFWIKIGSYVVVDDSGREKALESGSKIACMVSQVLFHEQVRALEKSSEWPTIFQTKVAEHSKDLLLPSSSEIDQILSSEDEDGLPPLEANLNRNSPLELYSDSTSGSDSDDS
ncbi:hypothetical protein J5N97_002785 [Dioscorea zingiberensis]|uniref:S1-like domain-containing protein n=1 Tax=Dioscorea zingiberensis TaxID=325984 RepID=A0A9D5D4J6_9LILI|nr:hypothetical protein J5N97_002785 [Dioscorea zingiberensis]